ncbi:hypothetical protein FCOIX_895 [Fusarium coicis]|nr:hypothetical protein FCOIX_895 [Fusarium coicis]
MTLLVLLYFLLGLLSLPSSAAKGKEPAADNSSPTKESLLKIWEVDGTCDSQVQFMEDSMEIALEIVTATLSALEFIKNSKLPSKQQDPKGYHRTSQFGKHVKVFLGSNQLKNLAIFSSQLVNLFAKMKRTIPASENDPPKGYVTHFQHLPDHKPKLMCGDSPGEKSWKWYGSSDTIPGQQRNLMSMNNDFRQYALENWDGAWYYDRTLAGVAWDKDIIIFCDNQFTPRAKALKTPKAWKASGISEGLSLNAHKDHFSVVMVHELIHWFGGTVSKDGAKPTAKIDDQIAIDDDGKPIYQKGERLLVYHPVPSADEIEDDNLKPLLAYGMDRIWQLAFCGERPVQDYCGAAKAMRNADSLALFALAMYYEDWDWSHSVARVLGKEYQKAPKKRPGDKQGQRPPKPTANIIFAILERLPDFPPLCFFTILPHLPLSRTNHDMSLSPREPDAEEIERKWTAIWESRVKELPLLPDPRPRALAPDPFQISDTASKQAPRPLYQESASWFKVPPNIRRDILRLAFGDARLHMYMEYGYPDVPRDAESKYHCNIVV